MERSSCRGNPAALSPFTRPACASCASARFRRVADLFRIYDEDDRQSLVKEAMRELDFDERALTPAAVVHRISHAKNQMLSSRTWSSSR